MNIHEGVLTDEEFGILATVLRERSELVPTRNPLDVDVAERSQVQDLLLDELSEREFTDNGVTARGEVIERIIDKFRPWDE